MALTYKAIGTHTIGTATNIIEFTNISADYTDLLIKFSLRTTENAVFTDQGFRVTFNSNTTGYYNVLLYGIGNAAGTAKNSNQDHLRWVYGNSDTAVASAFGSGEMYIPNYSGSQKKSTNSYSVSETNSATTPVMATAAGFWDNAAAITSVKFTTNTGNFKQYSTVMVYGIKNTV